MKTDKESKKETGNSWEKQSDKIEVPVKKESKPEVVCIKSNKGIVYTITAALYEKNKKYYKQTGFTLMPVKEAKQFLEQRFS